MGSNDQNVATLLHTRECPVDYQCMATDCIDCCKSRPFKTPAANVDFRAYMVNGMNRFLGTAFTEKDFLLIFTTMGCGINRKLTREFIRAGCDLEVLKRQRVERMISADRLLETLNGLEYRARTLEQMRGGNDVLRKLLPKVIAQQKTLRSMQIVTCERCDYWIPLTCRCSLTGRKKRKDGFCDEGKETVLDIRDNHK